VVSGKEKQDSFNGPYRLQYVNFSRENAMETRFHGVVISESLLVYHEQAREVPWFRLFSMALARIQKDRLVRTGA
jgi:hypothetical protein